jgi:hypothetical protein
VEEEDKFIEEYFFSVDWVSPLIYDIYPDEEDLLKVSFVVNTENFTEENNNYDVFDESPKF